MGSLNNIYLLLDKSHKAFKKHIQALRAKACRDKTIVDAAAPPISSGPLVRLYSSLAKHVGKKNIMTTLINLTSAALHLGCLLKAFILVLL